MSRRFFRRVHVHRWTVAPDRAGTGTAASTPDDPSEHDGALFAVVTGEKDRLGVGNEVGEVMLGCHSHGIDVQMVRWILPHDKPRSWRQ